jgi:hypothetical protein
VRISEESSEVLAAQLTFLWQFSEAETLVGSLEADLGTKRRNKPESAKPLLLVS